MDWYSWLSKTNLDPSLVYEYGLIFVQNELEKEDLADFNHDFLQSIGISVAKHRIEILKVARKETRQSLNGFARLAMAMTKTKRLLAKNISKLGFHKSSSQLSVSELTPYKTQWSGALRKPYLKDDKPESKAIIPSVRSTMKSGPLDRRMQEKTMVTSRSLSVSGPLDGKMQERFTYHNLSPLVSFPADGKVKERSKFPCRSPTISGPIDGWSLSPRINNLNNKMDIGNDDGAHSLWSLMFQDMKPT